MNTTLNVTHCAIRYSDSRFTSLYRGHHSNRILRTKLFVQVVQLGQTQSTFNHADYFSISNPHRPLIALTYVSSGDLSAHLAVHHAGYQPINGPPYSGLSANNSSRLSERRIQHFILGLDLRSCQNNHLATIRFTQGLLSKIAGQAQLHALRL